MSPKAALRNAKTLSMTKVIHELRMIRFLSARLVTVTRTKGVRGIKTQERIPLVWHLVQSFEHVIECSKNRTRRVLENALASGILLGVHYCGPAHPRSSSMASTNLCHQCTLCAYGLNPSLSGVPRRSHSWDTCT